MTNKFSANRPQATAVGTNIMLYISSSPHVLKDCIAIPNPRVIYVYKLCRLIEIHLVVIQLFYYPVSPYLLPIGRDRSSTVTERQRDLVAAN